MSFTQQFRTSILAVYCLTLFLGFFLIGGALCSLDNETEVTGSTIMSTTGLVSTDMPSTEVKSTVMSTKVVGSTAGAIVTVPKASDVPESTSDPASTLPRTTDVCGLSLMSQSEQDMARNHKCKCNSFNEEVDCSYIEVTTLPKLISFPKGARHVNFRFNKIQNIGQDTFYSGQNVLDLDLSHNSINFISIVAFRGFKNLRQLDLSHNDIWNLPSKSCEGLTSLRVLDVSYNKLIGVSSELFAEVPNVTELHLESNPLQELHPKVFEHLRYLEVLYLGSTMLRVIPDHLFVFTPHLKFLDLSENLLTYVPTDALKVLRPLKFLDLSGNHITTIKEESFIGMRGLVTLHLERMHQLTDIEKYAFGDLQMLQELHCNYNFLLSDIDEKAFVKKSDNKKIQLSQLFLRQNALQTLPKDLLAWNENIELQISGNPLFCDCHMEWMVHLKLKDDFQKNAKCSGPSHLQGIALSDLKDQQLDCGMHMYEVVMIVLASVTFLLILALIIAFIVWRKHYSGYKRPYFRVSKKKNIDIDERIEDGM